jgi:hypothetical protein
VKFQLRRAVEDMDQQAVNDGLVSDLNSLAQFFYVGSGAPTLTPPGRALYINRTGGAGTTLYVYEGAGWVGK